MVAYGWESPCLRCGVTGGPEHTISSTPDVDRMADLLADRLEPLCLVQGRMLGVMQADGEWIVSLSGVASVRQEFVNTVTAIDPSMSPIAHDWSTAPTRSLGGHAIGSILQRVNYDSKSGQTWGAFLKVNEAAAGSGAARLRRSLPLAGGPGCRCAAPKLVSYLTQDAGSAALPPKRVAMIELWCGASLGKRHHKQRAESCENCKRILPTLMCRAPG